MSRPYHKNNKNKKFKKGKEKCPIFLKEKGTVTRYKQKITSKMIDISVNILLVTLNVSGLNFVMFAEKYLRECYIHF
jgi:hypothetical protein